MYEFRGGFHLHLLKNSCAIGGDGWDAEGEMLGDFGNSLSLADETKDFVLTFGKIFVQFGFVWFDNVFRKSVGQSLAYVLASTQNFTDSFEQFFRRGIFGDVARSACLHGTHSDSLFRVHAEHQRFNRGKTLSDILQSFDSAPSRHIDVHNNKVNFSSRKKTKHPRRISGFTNNVQVFLLRNLMAVKI